MMKSAAGDMVVSRSALQARPTDLLVARVTIPTIPKQVMTFSRPIGAPILGAEKWFDLDQIPSDNRPISFS
jgi:hypothetical protein